MNPNTKPNYNRFDLGDGKQGCVYYPHHLFFKPVQKVFPEYITKIVVHSPKQQMIQGLIKKIPKYPFFFYTFYQSNPIQVGQMNEQYIESTKPLKTQKEMVLLKYKNINIVSFNDWNNKSNKVCFQYFHYLVYSLEILLSHEMVHLEITDKTILYHMDEDIPLIKITNQIIYIKDNIESILQTILRFTTDDYPCPIEIYIIQYLQNNNVDSLSITNIYEIIQNYKNQYLLDLIDLISYFKQYINKPTKQIIQELMMFSNTWGNYSLAFLFLKLINQKTKQNQTQNSFLNQWVKVLESATHKNPTKRTILKDDMHNLNLFFMT